MLGMVVTGVRPTDLLQKVLELYPVHKLQELQELPFVSEFCISCISRIRYGL